LGIGWSPAHLPTRRVRIVRRSRWGAVPNDYARAARSSIGLRPRRHRSSKVDARYNQSLLTRSTRTAHLDRNARV